MDDDSGRLQLDPHATGAGHVTFGEGIEGLARLRHHGEQNAAVTARVTYHSEDIARAMQHFLRHRRSPGRRALFGAVLLLALADLKLGGGGAAFGLMVWLALVFASTQIYLTRVYPARLFRREAAFQGEHLWEFTDDGVFVRRPDAEARLGWPAVQQVWESTDGFLVFPQHNHFHYIPKRAFRSEEEMDRLRELAQRHTRFECG
jgi:hypothetical protein